MAKNRKGTEPKGALEILEESVELLRRAPVSALAAYYLGSVPFGLGFLYFWADMSRGSDAFETVSQEAFGVTLLFVWMKTWQSYFSRVLWAYLAQGREPRWTPGWMARTALVQAAIQPLGFVAIPAAALVTLPFAWVYAFFQNLTVLGEGEGGLRRTASKAWKLTGVWPRQNNVALLCLTFFGFFLFVNIAIALTIGPALLKQLFGVETLFSRSLWSMFNTTFFAVVCVMTYLCVDPILKSLYTLRCFYGESLFNGEDLKAEWKLATAATRAAVLLLFLGFAAAPALAGPPPEALAQGGQAKQAVKSPELDRSITEALKGDEYRWHMPRLAKPEKKPEKPGIVFEFLEGSIKYLVKGVKKVFHWIDDFFKWVNKHFQPDPDVSPDKKKRHPGDWHFEWLYLFLWLLLAGAVCALALLLYRLWKRRERPVAVAQAVMPKPDVADEKVSGAELPMDGWLQMAQDLLRQGNFRLALRAFYLASLACLARQRLLTIAKFKSTLDYERELHRRAHSFPQMLTVFDENGRIFDRGWYGEGDVTREAVELFAANHDKIQKSVEPLSVERKF